MSKLLKAILEDNIEEVNKLLKRIDPQQVYEYNNLISTPLELAVKHNNIRIVNRLLEDPRVIPDYGSFMNAVDNNNIEILNRLLQNPRTRREELSSAIVRQAINNGFMEIVDILLKDGRFNLNEVLSYAAKTGNMDVIDYILSDPSFVADNSALETASYEHQTDVVNRLLKDPRFDPTNNNYRAISKAAEKKNTKIVNILLNDIRVDWNDLIDHDFYTDNTVEGRNMKRIHNKDVNDFIKEIINMKKKVNKSRMRVFNNIGHQHGLNSDLNRKIFGYIARGEKNVFGKYKRKSMKRKSNKKKSIRRNKRKSKK